MHHFGARFRRNVCNWTGFDPVVFGFGIVQSIGQTGRHILGRRHQLDGQLPSRTRISTVTSKSDAPPLRRSDLSSYCFLLQEVLGAYVFLIFAVILALNVVFIYKKVPETKNKTMEEISAMFRQQSYQ